MDRRLNRNGAATRDRKAPTSDLDLVSRIQEIMDGVIFLDDDDDVIVLDDDEPAKTLIKKEKVEPKQRGKKRPLYDNEADAKARERRMLLEGYLIERDLVTSGALQKFDEENAREKEIARRAEMVERTTNSTINKKPLSSWSNGYGAMRARREVPPPPPPKKAKTESDRL